MLAYLLEHKNPRGRIETNSKSFDNIWSGNTEKKIGQRTAFFFIFIGWSFTNYVDKNLGFFWPPPPSIDIFYGIDIDWEKVEIFGPTTYIVVL